MSFACRPNYLNSEVVQPLPGGLVSSLTLSPANANATLNFNSDGTVSSSHNGSGLDVSHNWHLNPAGGVGTNFWVRATVSAGTTPTSGTVDSWLQLSSNRSWANADAVANGLSVTSTLTIEIATDSGGSNIVTSGSYTVVAEKDV